MQLREEGTIRRIVNGSQAGSMFLEHLARSVSQASDLKFVAAKVSL